MNFESKFIDRKINIEIATLKHDINNVAKNFISGRLEKTIKEWYEKFNIKKDISKNFIYLILLNPYLKEELREQIKNKLNFYEDYVCATELFFELQEVNLDLLLLVYNNTMEDRFLSIDNKYSFCVDISKIAIHYNLFENLLEQCKSFPIFPIVFKEDLDETIIQNRVLNLTQKKKDLYVFEEKDLNSEFFCYNFELLLKEELTQVIELFIEKHTPKTHFEHDKLFHFTSKKTNMSEGFFDTYINKTMYDTYINKTMYNLNSHSNETLVLYNFLLTYEDTLKRNNELLLKVLDICIEKNIPLMEPTKRNLIFNESNLYNFKRIPIPNIRKFNNSFLNLDIESKFRILKSFKVKHKAFLEDNFDVLKFLPFDKLTDLIVYHDGEEFESILHSIDKLSVNFINQNKLAKKTNLSF